jgi:hypothetical protein
MCSFEYSAAGLGRHARAGAPADASRGRKLDRSADRAYRPRLLLDLDCHETQMTWQTLHNIGAHSVRPGTASRLGNRFLGTAIRVLRCPGVSNYGVMTKPRGGKNP